MKALYVFVIEAKKQLSRHSEHTNIKDVCAKAQGNMFLRLEKVDFSFRGPPKTMINANFSV